MKRFGIVSAAVAVAAVGAGLLTNSAYAVASTCTWTGTAGDSKFSTATNWSGCNSTAPQTGDIVLLPYIPTTQLTLANDLPQGTLLGGLTMDTKQAGGTGYADYTVDNLAFGNNAVITVVSGWGPTVTGSLDFAGSVTFNNTSPYMFIATSDGKTTTPTDMTINNPTLTTACGGAGGGTTPFQVNPSGNVTVGTSTYYGIVGTEASVTVGSKALISLPGGTYAGNITFNTGGSTQAPTCNVDSAYSVQTYNDTTLSGTITLNSGDVMYNIGTGKTLTMTGKILGSGAGLKAYVGSTGTFVNNASQNTSTTPGGAQTVSMQTLPAITDSKPTVGLDMISNTTVSFDGVRSYGTVADKAVLMGGGTFMGSLYVAALGTVAPGHSPGCITSDTLALNGTYKFDLGGTDPCTGYDQLIVKNAANVTTAVTLDSNNSVLTTNRYNNYTPKQNQVFVIINQAGSAAVSGTFKGLPEGATFSQNNITFKISYKGGDGNDVTLTVMNQPTAPDTGIAILKANPAVTAGAAVAVAMVLAGIAKFSTKRR